MKTIIVIYTNAVLPATLVSNQKKYCFTTSDNIEVGDLLRSPSYTTCLQVVKVVDKAYKYYNEIDGKMSNSYNSTRQWKIKELIMRDTNPEVVYASKVNKK